MDDQDLSNQYPTHNMVHYVYKANFSFGYIKVTDIAGSPCFLYMSIYKNQVSKLT
jgi:hypothetical protein